MTINPYVVDPPRVTGRRYRIRFLPIRRDTTGGDTTAFYSYDLWDLDLGQRLIANRVASVIQNRTLVIDNSPIVDGLEIETRHLVTYWTFRSGTVTVAPPYPYPALGDTTNGPSPAPRFAFQPHPWQFRGTLFKVTWHRGTGSKGDSLWLTVRDSTNQVDVPVDTLASQITASTSGWCFGGNNTTARGKSYLDSSMVSIVGGIDTIPTPKRYPGTWLTLCGRRYWFYGKLGGYDGRPMFWPGGVCPINDGDVWLIQPSGDRPPHDGDVYTFQTQVGVAAGLEFGPLSFWLGQAYPNPATHQSVIPFSLASKGKATLKVYNVTGALVRTLVDGDLEPGRYQASWDGKNDFGKRTASGVYLYRLEAPGKAAVRKLVLLR